MGVAPRRSQRGRTRYLIVRAGERRHALPVAAIRRIVRSLVVHPVAGALPELLGLAQFGGEPFAVLELAALVEGEPSPASEIAVILHPRATGEPVALMVDEALELVTIPDDEIGAPGEGMVVGEALIGDTPVRILDLERIAAEVS